MEQNKLDNEIRSKLQQRTINPSPMAWDRLDAMLSVAEEKKQPKKRTWMYVAASFLGFLLVGTIFLKQGSDKSSNTVVKDAHTVATAPSAKEDTNTTDANTPSPIQEAIKVAPTQLQNQPQVAVMKQNTASQKAVAAPKAVKINEASVVLQQQEAVAENTGVKEKQLIANDADELLNQSLAQNQMPGRKSLKVDSKSLLSSVEGELDQSFKEKALQGAIKNFNTIKTSVANRNHK